MSKRIYLCLAHMSEAGLEQKYIQEAFDTNWVVPLGPNVNAFENDLRSFLVESGVWRSEDYLMSSRQVVALASGTAAVHLALLACGVGPGDEVIAQSFTFCASSHPIVYVGATPVFVDSERETWNMDPVLLEKAIQDRIAVTGKKPKAILPVFLYGMPPKLDEILAVAAKYEIPVIEDAAEGFGSIYKGQMAGTFGKYGILSFNGNKMITTSGGGALVCPDANAAQKVKWLATQAREAYPYYQHETIGYNYRMSNICAGIGRGQMTVVNEHVARHRRIAKIYEEAFQDVQGITYHAEPKNGKYMSNYWLSTILLDADLKVKNQDLAYSEAVNGAVGGAAGVVHSGGTIHTDCEPYANVEALRMALDFEDIESRPLWKPMHCQPVYQRMVDPKSMEQTELDDGIVRQTSSASVAYINGVSEDLFKRGLCLPSGPMVTDEDVQRIIKVIKSSIKYS